MAQALEGHVHPLQHGTLEGLISRRARMQTSGRRKPPDPVRALAGKSGDQVGMEEDLPLREVGNGLKLNLFCPCKALVMQGG